VLDPVLDQVNCVGVRASAVRLHVEGQERDHFTSTLLPAGAIEARALCDEPPPVGHEPAACQWLPRAGPYDPGPIPKTHRQGARLTVKFRETRPTFVVHGRCQNAASHPFGDHCGQHTHVEAPPEQYCTDRMAV
jgi:hypothetical protein